MLSFIIYTVILLFYTVRFLGCLYDMYIYGTALNFYQKHVFLVLNKLLNCNLFSLLSKICLLHECIV